MNETRRFARQTRRGSALSLSEPLPSVLAALLDQRVQAHRKLATRLLSLQTQVVESRRKLEAARASDEQAKVRAASEGRSMPRAQKSAAAEKQLAADEDELRAFENALSQSADGLLLAALPHLREALARVVEELQHEQERSEELRLAVDRSLERQQSLAAELHWIESVDASDGARVEPFREVLLDRDVGQVRAGLRQLFEELSWKRERRAEEQARLRAWEDEQREAWAAQEQQVRRQQEAERVVVSEGRIVERGGRKVRQTGFGIQDEDEEEP